jgi:hypothetical protein
MLSTTICSLDIILHIGVKDQDPNWLIRIPQLPLSGELYHCHCSELSL